MDSNDAAIVQASMQTLNNAANIASTNRMNKKTRQFNIDMYNRQRADNLADWNMINEYNHPSSQMARLREAGLNPNLVYGKGADNTSAAVSSADVKSWNPETPRFAVATPFDNMYNFEMKQAQIDNLRVQNTVATQEAILKGAQTANVISNTATTDQQRKQAEQLFPYSLNATIENIRKTQADTQFTLDQNQRAKVMQTYSIKEAISRLLNNESQRLTDKYQRSLIMGQMKNIEADMRLKALDENLKRQGIQPHDNMWFRILAQQWDRIKSMVKEKSGIDFRVLK